MRCVCVCVNGRRRRRRRARTGETGEVEGGVEGVEAAEAAEMTRVVEGAVIVAEAEEAELKEEVGEMKFMHPRSMHPSMPSFPPALLPACTPSPTRCRVWGICTRALSQPYALLNLPRYESPPAARPRCSERGASTPAVAPPDVLAVMRGSVWVWMLVWVWRRRRQWCMR